MKKWICSLILTAAVMLTLGIAVAAETLTWGDFNYTVNEDGVSVTITGYTGTGGDVMIPEKIGEYAVTAIGDSAFASGNGSYNYNIKYVSLPEGLISIGKEAFSCCGGLTKVSFPDTLTFIGYQAFYCCTRLTDISFPERLDSISFSGASFYNCDSLTTVVLPEGLVSIPSDAFGNCDKLSSVLFPDGLTTVGDYAFSFCNELTDVSFPDTLTFLGQRAFHNCSKLISAYFHGDIPDYFGYETLKNSVTIYYSNSNSTKWTSPTWKDPYGSVYNTATFVPEAPPCITLVTGTEEYGDIQIPIEDFTYSNLVKNFGQIFNLFKEGYSFGGWHTDSSQSSKISFELDTDAIRQAAQKAQEVSKTVSLYVDWVENSKITLEKDDVFDFTNNRYYFCSQNYDLLPIVAQNHFKYDIYSKDLTKLFWSGNGARILFEADRHWKGSCFGMSAVVVLAANKVFSPNDFEQTTVADMCIPLSPMPTCTQIESLINYYHLAQYNNDIEKKTHEYSKKNRADNVKVILDKLKITNDPVLLNISFVNTSGHNVGGHTVVAYDLAYDKQTESYIVKIYDCSLTHSSSYQFYEIKFDEDGDVWDLEYTNAWKETRPDLDISWIFYKSAITADELVQHIPAYLDNPVTAASAASAAISAAFTLSTDASRYTLETNYNSFRIESGDLYADVDNSTITGTLDIQFSDVLNEIGAPIELAYSLPILEDGAVYSVTPSADNNLDEYRTTFMYDDAADGFYLRADADACGTITLGTDTLLSTSFPETAEQELTVALNAWNAPWQSLVMNGSSTGYQVVSAEDGAQFTSDTPTTVSVSAEVFLDSVQFEEIELTSAGITVTESEDRVCSILSGEETVSTRNIGHYVIFDSRLGSNVDTVYDIPDDGLCEEPTEPTREGYLFTGWYTDLLFENKWDFAEDTVTDNMTLYAGWTRDPDYYCTVVFHFEDHAELLFVKRGEGLSEEALPDIPHKNGVIQKWDIDDLSSITEDMDVYIKTSTIGDINGDNEVTPEDYNILIDYFSGKSADVTISSAAADLNDDSRVTRADAMILARYLAKWPGYAEKYFQ